MPYENGRHNWLSADWSGYIVFLIVVAGDSIFLRSGELGIFFFSLVQSHKKIRIINEKVTSGFDLHFSTSLSRLDRLAETLFVSFSIINLYVLSLTFKTPMKCSRARPV